MKKENKKPQIAIYQTLGDEQKIRVRIEDENVWLTQKLIAELFTVSVPTVNEHLKNIFESNELEENSVIRNFRITAADRKEYENKEELDEYLKKVRKDGKTEHAAALNRRERAEDLIEIAYDKEDREERIALVKRAVDIYPDLPDAYNLLAEEAESAEEALGYYAKGVEAGKRMLGEAMFTEDKGHFWGILETRPFMRAKAGLARSLWNCGKYDESLKHYIEMLELNPGDNQGIRYAVLFSLADLSRFEELKMFMEREEYKTDCGTEWLYTKALLMFNKSGRTEETERLIKDAIKTNKYVPEYITGLKQVPRQTYTSVVFGGEDEACSYAGEFGGIWKRFPKAIDWLREKADLKLRLVKTGRNEPCPCGSGKKYKKCCGK